MPRDSRPEVPLWVLLLLLFGVCVATALLVLFDEALVSTPNPPPAEWPGDDAP